MAKTRLKKRNRAEVESHNGWRLLVAATVVVAAAAAWYTIANHEQGVRDLLSWTAHTAGAATDAFFALLDSIATAAGESTQ